MQWKYVLVKNVHFRSVVINLYIC